MKIALVADKIGSAIDRLSQAIIKHNPHLDFECCYLHPKRPSVDEVTKVVKAVNECDILHIAYWKSGETLKQYVDWTALAKPKILFHYNPYNVDQPEINDQYDIVVVGNSTMRDALPSARLVNYGTDLSFWTYNEEYKEDGPVIMVVARIEGKKGVKEVAQACKKLKRKFVLVGRVSDPNYLQEIKDVNPEVEFRENVTDEELRVLYYQSALHVCNSQDNFESGTLPILEAMACGVPVLTRVVGHVPDLVGSAEVVSNYMNPQNVATRSGAPEDVEDLTKAISEMLTNPLLLKKMREKGWDTVKNWSDRKMARKVGRIYYDAQRDGENTPFVSIIMPTMLKKPEALIEALSKACLQDYKYTEIILVNSGVVEFDIKEFARVAAEKLGCKIPPIRYIKIDKRGGEYTLARARNTAIIEAQGDILVFCDERVGMDTRAVTAFVQGWASQSWQWGIKDDCEKGFVENFSCCSRSDLIENGMFNETVCSRYGAMTEDIRSRLEKRGWAPWVFKLNRNAKAMAVSRTSGKASRRADIIESKFTLYKTYGE